MVGQVLGQMPMQRLGQILGQMLGQRRMTVLVPKQVLECQQRGPAMALVWAQSLVSRDP